MTYCDGRKSIFGLTAWFTWGNPFGVIVLNWSFATVAARRAISVESNLENCRKNVRILLANPNPFNPSKM